MRWLSPLAAAVLLGSAPAHGGVEPAPPSRTHVIEMRNFVFSPASLEVAVGDTVVWINRDAAPHTATDSAAAWGSGAVKAEGRWSRVVDAPGRFPYLCDYHPSMRGELIVGARGDGTIEGGPRP